MGMTPTLVSVDEYLPRPIVRIATTSSGRYWRETSAKKTKTQRAILFFLHERSKRWNIFVIQEQRIQLSPMRYRVSAICVVLGPEPDEQIFTLPRFLRIEVLSPG